MKKIIRLAESDLVHLVERVISERKFANQSGVDRVLDKINAQGINSLTQGEKEILDNPDVVYDEPEYDEPNQIDFENTSKFTTLYNMIINDLNFIYTDFPQRWEVIKNDKEKAIIFKNAVTISMRGISQGIDTLEELGDLDSEQVYECNQLFVKVGNMLKKLFN